MIGLIASLMLNTFYASAVNDEAFDDTSFRESELSEEVISEGNNIPAEDVSSSDLNSAEGVNEDLTINDTLLTPFEDNKVMGLSVSVDHVAETTAQLSWENLGEGYTYVISLNSVVVGECTENTYQITGLTGGTTYEVSVEALGEAGKTVAVSEPITVYTDWTVSSNLTLYENKTVENLSVTNGTLNLNGYTLTAKRLSMSSSPIFVVKYDKEKDDFCIHLYDLSFLL